MGVPLTENSGSQSTKIATGVYARKYIIKDILDHSNPPEGDRPNTVGQNGYQPDHCLELVLKDEKADFEKTVLLFGYYKRDKVTRKYLGGIQEYRNAIVRFLVRMLPKGQAQLEDDLSISPKLLHAIKGKEIIIVTYISTRQYLDEKSGNMKFSNQTWSNVFEADATEEDIRNEWEHAVDSIKDYNPQAAMRMESSKKEEEANYQDDPISPDDDPPF